MLLWLIQLHVSLSLCCSTVFSDRINENHHIFTFQCIQRFTILLKFSSKEIGYQAMFLQYSVTHRGKGGGRHTSQQNIHLFVFVLLWLFIHRREYHTSIFVYLTSASFQSRPYLSSRREIEMLHGLGLVNTS